jgi:4-amino-4-deoxy-L-arabinose transferase-like glycosyltransferase
VTVTDAHVDAKDATDLRLIKRAWARLDRSPGSDGLAAKGREVPGTMIIAAIGLIIGLIATYWSWRQGWLHMYTDAITHSTIARRVLDSQNTGFQQLGTVWLPVPHVLLMPFVYILPLYQSGLAGGLLGAMCMAVCAGAIWRITYRAGFNRPARLVSVAIFVLNPSILYLFTTALTESVLIATILASLAGLSGWITAMPAISPGELAVFAGIPAALSVLSRYEGWAFVGVGTLFVIIASWRRWRSISYTVTLVFAFVAAPAIAVMWWLLYNFVRYGDPLDFARGTYSAAAQQQDLTDLGLLPSKGNLGLAVRTFNWNVMDILGPGLLILAAIGAVAIIWTRGASTTALILWIPAYVYPFALLSLYLGQTVIRNDVSLPQGLFNIRYAALLVPLSAVLIGGLVDLAYSRARRWAPIVVAGVMIVVVGFATWQITNPKQNLGVIREGYLIAEGIKDEVNAAVWLSENYTGGSILIDDVHGQGLINLGVPLEQLYSTFNGAIFDTALKEPYRYVDWVYADSANDNDQVWKAIKSDPDFNSRFYPVFQSGSFTVWESTRAMEPGS